MRIITVVLLLVLVIVLVSPWLTKEAASNGPTVQVAVHASDPHGFALHYRWKATDGTITNVNQATTSWTLPPGPGLHFAYVLISNNHGGYTERRVAVNTDGNPPVIPPPVNLAAPPAPPQSGDYYRMFLRKGVLSGQYFSDYVVDFPAFVKDNTSGNRYPPTTNVLSSLRGEIVVPGLPAGGSYSLMCSFDGGTTFSNCENGLSFSMPQMPARATTDYSPFDPMSPPQPTNVSVKLADGISDCGTINEFFGLHVTATAKLLNSSGLTLSTARASEFGTISFPYNASAASVQVTCESATPVSYAFTPSTNGEAIYLIIAGVAVPFVDDSDPNAMTAMLGTQSVGIFLPPPTTLPAEPTKQSTINLPSDQVPHSDIFLANKGSDTQLGACRYYMAIGAVQSCDASGNPTGAISFEDWKRTVKIGKYATPGTTEYVANFVNIADLNLTRNHHSISYGPNETAAYVCNSNPPPFALVNQQSDIDNVVNLSVNSKKLVACVAMDWGITTGVNNNQPFTRFLIFGPSGQLLLSVNLDGRTEKYVPGTCVVCHGGDHYAGKFPEDGTGSANIGAHFLPYDEGNFRFSSVTGLRQVDQENAIYHLNQNVLATGPTQNEAALINGWYAHGQTEDQTYLPTSYQGQPQSTIDFYQKVHARSCRGCHIAMDDYQYNWDSLYNYIDPLPVCGLVSYEGWKYSSMPNSLVTLNRFWLSKGNTVGLPDQPSIFASYPGYGSCTQ
jgi:hypothetical protein